MWNLFEKREEFSLSNSHNLNSLAVSEDVNWIVSGHDDGSLKLWNFNTQSVEKNLYKFDSPVLSVGVNKDATLIVSISDKAIKIFNKKTKNYEFSQQEKEYYFSCVALSPNEQWIALGSNIEIKILDLIDYNEVHTLRNITSPVTSISISSSGQ